MAVRRNTQCPRCKHDATFLAASTNGMAWYRCAHWLGKHACGKWFEAPHPKPLPKAIDYSRLIRELLYRDERAA
jgi:hypothetical protein